MSDDEVVTMATLKKHCGDRRGECAEMRATKAAADRPNQIITTASLLASTLGVAVGIMFYVSASEIKSHRIEEAAYYVSKEDNEQQVQRIESRLGRVEETLSNNNAMLVGLGNKIDRNYEQLKARAK
jgi:hypothetical protein